MEGHIVGQSDKEKRGLIFVIEDFERDVWADPAAYLGGKLLVAIVICSDNLPKYTPILAVRSSFHVKDVPQCSDSSCSPVRAEDELITVTGIQDFCASNQRCLSPSFPPCLLRMRA
jgi:hypothetical protein